MTVKIPEILLPSDRNNMHRWAVNACDQFTSDNEYWKQVESITAGYPSTYNLIYPEIYLKDDPEKRIARINENMRRYLDGNIFDKLEGLVLVERSTESGTRTGIVLAIDLEDYSYEKGAKTLIRSTEATILERIPPRVAIRKDAPIELPHIMLLYDDETNSVLNGVERGEVLYDSELMLGGGHIKGTKISNPDNVISSLYNLCSKERSEKRYGVCDGLLFAVGDGNHSLATAKTCWEDLKRSLSGEEKENHPARFALCEAVNIYDAALRFEPIHRYIKCDKVEKFAEGLKTSGSSTAYIVVNGKKSKIPFNENIPEGIRGLDKYIADFIAENGGEVDYIHGEEGLVSYTENCGVGVILPAIGKDDFFRLIATGGNLPRKTFSMGEGNEKRYYVEARIIK